MGLVLIPIRSLLYWALHYFQFLSNSIADERLKRAVKDCWRVFDTVEDMMTKIWLYIRPPTSSERKWAATSHGDTRSEDLFRIYYRYRKAFLGEVRRKKQDLVIERKTQVANLRAEIVKSIKELKSRYTDTTKEYLFPLNKLLKLIYPEDLQKSLCNTLGLV